MLPLIGLRVGERVDDAEVEPELITQALGEPLGLGEQVPGVEEDDLGVRNRLADQVDEYGVAEAGRDEQAVPEVAACPAQDVEWMGVLERVRQLIEVDDVHVSAHLSKSGTNPE